MAQPTLRVVRGNASADEVAAITAVLLSLKAQPVQTHSPFSTSRWADPAQRMRRPLDRRNTSWKSWTS